MRDASPFNRIGAILSVSFVAVIISGCKPQSLPNIPTAYARGMAENALREKAGLRLIEPSWICYQSIDNKDLWMADPKTDVAAVKIVRHRNDGTLLTEADRYWSGRLVKVDDDDQVQEELTLVYDYTTSSSELVYIGDDGQIETWCSRAKSTQDCLEVIDKVKKTLGQWGEVSRDAVDGPGRRFAG
jgi:hypothetical protein